ncbi:MAG: transcriptional regulator NrdR [Oscillospiraceae bacterium]
MVCPFCGYDDSKVIDSRPYEGKIRRRRECIKCGKRFTTFESIEIPELLVNKKDNTFERFNRAKLIQSMSIAVKKRPVSLSDINRIVDSIENYCMTNMLSQITTSQIGDMVLSYLKELDKVAYVRFASVYKDFSDVESFLDIISELRGSDDTDSASE